MPIKGVDRDFWCGDSVKFVASNRPYTDITVPPSLNDFRWAEYANLKVYDPSDVLVVDQEMSRTDRVGWYSCTYQTDCAKECSIGIYRAEITFCATVYDECFTTETTGSSGSIGTSGTSGTSNLCCDVAVSYFRVNERVRY